MKVVIVGGGAAGGTAAQFARKADRKAEIVVINRENKPQYSRCGLPYAVAGKIKSFEELIEFSEEWFAKNNIKLMLGHDVTAIDSNARVLTVKELSSNKEEKVNYDSLVLATGATPFLPPIDGIYADAEKKRLKQCVAPLRTIDDGARIVERAKKGGSAVIVGGGFIGLETAEGLHERGMDVTVVEFLPNILLQIADSDMADLMKEKLNDKFHFMLNSKAIRVLGDKNVEGIVVQNNEDKKDSTLPADLVVLAAGNRANTELARLAGCEIGTANGIKVNAKCETTVANIYAAGDCTEYFDFVTGEPIPVGMGTIAVKQGKVAGANAVLPAGQGKEEMLKGVLNTRGTDVLGAKIAGVGPTTAALEKKGIRPLVGKYTGSTLPHYYPGGMPLVVKVLAHPETGKMLGAQIFGETEVFQRINVFATAIMAEMTLDKFSKLETVYAPPIAPTLDAMTIATDVALLRMRRR